jgi:hypothetical protein
MSTGKNAAKPEGQNWQILLWTVLIIDFSVFAGENLPLEGKNEKQDIFGGYNWYYASVGNGTCSKLFKKF